MVTDMLPRYRESLTFVVTRVAALETQRKAAMQARRYDEVKAISLRIAPLNDTIDYLIDMIREIKRHRQ